MNILTIRDKESHFLIWNCLSNTSDYPIIITKKEYPFNIIYVNSNWENLCLYKLDEVFMKPVSILSYRPIYKNLKINKKKDGTLFLHYFDIHNISNGLSLGKTIYFKNLN